MKYIKLKINNKNNEINEKTNWPLILHSKRNIIML